MLTVFMDFCGVVMAEFTPPGTTIKSETYCETLRVLKEWIRRKRKDMWRVGPDNFRSFLLHHDNASSHTAAPTVDFLEASQIKILEHPPYSPDLAPCDYFLFPKLKSLLRGHRFQSLEDMKTGVLRTLRSISADDFGEAITSMPIRWMKCIKAGGDYFEGKHIQIDPEADHGLEMFQGEAGDESQEADTDSESD